MKPFISKREKKLLMVGGAERHPLGCRLPLGSCGPVSVWHGPSPAQPVRPQPSCRLPASVPLPPPTPVLSLWLASPQVVIPLQAIANVAIIYLDEFTPAAESWFT